eukprot:5442813-Pyramimonas_sp.AAC.1
MYARVCGFASRVKAKGSRNHHVNISSVVTLAFLKLRASFYYSLNTAVKLLEKLRAHQCPKASFSKASRTSRCETTRKLRGPVRLYRWTLPSKLVKGFGFGRVQSVWDG